MIILSFLPGIQRFAVQTENAKSRFTRKFSLTVKRPSCQDTSALSCVNNSMHYFTCNIWKNVGSRHIISPNLAIWAGGTC